MVLYNTILVIMSLKTISKKDGLSNNNINSIVKGPGGQIWTASNSGINIIDLKNLDIKYLTSANGLISNEVFNFAVDSHSIYATTRKGIVRINTEEYFQSNIEKATVDWTEIRVNDKSISIDSLPYLDYSQNNVEFNFISLQYGNKGNVNYRYRIPEIDTNWYITKSRIARFSDLSFGVYQFEISAQNKSGKWSKTKQLVFEISPAIWQTNWFKISGTLILAILTISILYIRNRNKTIRQELESNIERYRYRALTSQMNPHFVFNALNSIQYFILDQNRRSASKYLSTFAKLIRASFENSKHELIPFHDEVDALKLYADLENLRLENKVQIVFDVDSNIDQVTVKVPPLIIQPFVENAFLHGLAPKIEGKKQLVIEIKNQANHIYVKIEDNGIGRKASSKLKEAKNLRRKKSSGVSMSEDRLKAITQLEKQTKLGYKFTIIDKVNANGESTGTIVEMLIPKINIS